MSGDAPGVTRPWWAVALLALSLPPAALCLLAPTARWWYGGELAANAALHAAILLLPAIVAWRRSRPVSTLLLGCLALGTLGSLRAAWEPRAPRPAAGATEIPIACANLYLYNDRAVRPAALQAAIDTGARILVIAESISSEDRARIPPERFPYQVWQPQLRRKWRDCVALLSAYPIVGSRVHDIETQPFIEAHLDVDGRPLTVIAVHTMSPVSPDKRRERDAQLADIAELVRAERDPVLLLGDCNLSVATPVWRDFRDGSGLRRVAGHEPASWPSPLGPCAITIDHLLGRDLALGDQRAFAIPGSDHRGLSGTIAFPSR